MSIGRSAPSPLRATLAAAAPIANGAATSAVLGDIAGTSRRWIGWHAARRSGVTFSVQDLAALSAVRGAGITPAVLRAAFPVGTDCAAVGFAALVVGAYFSGGDGGAGSGG
jgi:hypothetical protein